MNRSRLALLLLAAFAPLAHAGEADWLAGDWRISRGMAAPWLAPDADAPDTTTLLGARVEYRDDRVEGPGVLGCGNAKRSYSTRPPEGLFQGALPAPAADAARALGLGEGPVASVTLACDSGSFDLHRASDEAALLALDNVIWVLDRSPGARAASGSPEATVQTLLVAHFAADMGFLPELIDNKQPFLAPALRARIATYFAQPRPEDEVPPINADPFTDSQEYPVRFSVGAAVVDGTRARVPVRFDDGFRSREVEYQLVRDGEAWGVDDIAFEEGLRFTALLAQ